MKKFSYLVLILFAALLFSAGFQCSSPEMTTAKLAVKNKEFTKAQSYLEKELEKNPSNGEAYMMLAEVKQSQNDLTGAARTVVDGEKYMIEPNLKAQANLFKNQLWINAYNIAIDQYNQANATGKVNLYDNSVNMLMVAVTVRPQMAEFYSLMGSVFEAKGDTALAVKTYNKYSDLIEPTLNFAKEKGIFIGISRDNVISKLGKPSKTRGIKYNPQSDSIMVDYFELGSNEAWVFSKDSKEKKFSVYGWRYNPPKDWLQNEKEQPLSISISPFIALSQYYYNTKDYAKSVNNVLKILSLDPSNTEANSFLVSIYDIQGKKDEATKFVSDLVAKDPTNKYYHAQYGDILLQMGKFEDAIKQYEEALKIDPKYEEVLRNLAVSYKNYVATIQKKQQEAAGNDATKLNPSEYMPYLKKAAETFEKAKNTPRFSRDFEVLGELAEIYFVMNETDKLKVAVAEIENLESIVPPEQKSKYYYLLLRVYDKMLRNPEKRAKIEEKLKN